MHELFYLAPVFAVEANGYRELLEDVSSELGLTLNELLVLFLGPSADGLAQQLCLGHFFLHR